HGAPMKTRLCDTVAIVIFGMALSGCYDRVVNGPESVYQFAWWVVPATIIGAVVLATLGWFIRKTRFARLGVACLIVAPLLVAVVTPAMYSDRVVIDDEHFTARFGFWISPVTHDVRFDDLSELRHVAVPAERGKRYELHCVSKTGSITAIPCGLL